MVNVRPTIRLAQSILKHKFPSNISPSEYKPLKRAFNEKYKPRSLFSEFYGILIKLELEKMTYQPQSKLGRV